MELYYSLNGGEWTPLIEGQNISVSAGDKIRVKNVGTGYSTNNRFQFKKANNENGRYNVEGSITSLVGSEDEFTYIGAAFEGTGVVSAENLILPDGYYAGMFIGCTSLTTAPELSTTTLADYCYSSMFRGCTSLTTAPALPATTLADSCYQQMFYDCTSLTTAPELPATTLANQCYDSMFYGCTSLTTAPALPATTLANFCYSGMFVDCTSLTGVPIDYLPATTIDEFCYHSMFKGCTGLTTAPDLPATTLQRYCYGFMFSGCTNLNYIKCLATDISADNYSGTEGWVSGVASAGTFVKHPDMNDWTTGVNGIPVGWTAKGDTGVPLTFKVLSDGKIAWKARSNAAYRTIEYSKNGGEWITIESNTYSAGNNFSVVTGDIVQFRGNLKNTGNAAGNTFSSFSATTCTFKVYGNIMSLFNSTEFATATTFNYSASTYSLFYYCTGLTDASNLLLPATTLAHGCYENMFEGCTSLTTAPELPATTLATYCYQYMFGDCTSLTTAPELPATTLAQDCYREMFINCTSLTTAPELPATTLTNYCYYSMFKGCTSLTTAPELPATILAQQCYQNMFASCTSLTTAPSLPATTLAQQCYSNMFSGCTSLTTVPSDLLSATTLANQCYSNMFNGCTGLTTAPALPATTLTQNCYNGMFYGCTSLTIAPELPATTLTQHCYNGMFSRCSSLNYIKCLATDISATYCTYGWVNGVASSGRFIKDASMTGWTTGTSGIPSNWTVEDAT